MIKALFFDIDGTLVSFNTHEIPNSTVEALKEASARGIKIYISTGRPFLLINNLDLISQLIDGYITTNGAYCFIGDKVVSKKPIDNVEVNKFFTYADKYDFASIIVGKDKISVYNSKPIVNDIFRKILNVDFSFGEGRLEEGEDVFQITPFITPEIESEIIGNLSGVFSARWHPAFTDITAKGIDKGSALEKIVSFSNYSISETMAFGDGGNDLTIIKKAGIGVAMGNAGDELKRAADYVTSSVDDDGILNALKHFDVI